jgi:integrase
MAKHRGVYAKGAGIEIRYQVDGKRRSRYVDKPATPGNLANAARFRSKLIEAARIGESGDTRSQSFAECCEAFLSDKSRALKPSTVNGYRSKLEVYWGDLAERPIRSVRLADLREIDRSVEWRSQKTRRDAHAVLSGVFAWAIAEELADDNPARRLTAGEWQRPDLDPFDDAERLAVLAALRDGFRVFYGLMFETGMRTGELIALQWRDVHRDHVDVTGSTWRGKRGTVKTHQTRRVLLTAAARELLADQKPRTRFDPSGYVFISSRGTPYATDRPLTWAFRVACRNAGLRYRRPYYCRHTFATRAIMAGVQPAFVARQMGDRLETVMRHYARWISGDRDRMELAKLEPAADKNGESVTNENGRRS